MPDIRRVTDAFSVSPQMSPDDLRQASGFVLVINNRPDHEAPGQPTAAEMEAVARGAGMDYLHIPVVGRATEAQVQAMHDAVAQAKGPVLAFCRSGTRSINTWSQGQAQFGGRPRDELIRLGAAAGYDLSALLA